MPAWLVALSVTIVGGIVVAYYRHWFGLDGSSKAAPPPVVNQTSQTASNVKDSQVTFGANSPINQTVNNITVYQQRMETIIRNDDAAIRAIFNQVYILFSITERQKIVPYGGRLSEILEVDWKSGYSVAFTPDTVTVVLPNFVFHPPSGVRFEMRGGVRVTLSRTVEPFCRFLSHDGRNNLGIKTVANAADAVVVAMGVNSPQQ